MERTTFGLLFYIRRIKLNRNGEAPIFMKSTVNGICADLSVRKLIAPQYWNPAKGKAVENSRRCKELNLYLDAISMNLLRIRRDMELDGAAARLPAKRVNGWNCNPESLLCSF